jgi:DNA-binding HxlR family transcriptional regulator
MKSAPRSPTTTAQDAPGRLAQAVVGDGWTILILRQAFRGTRRYSDWRKQIRIPELVLADRLKRLTALGVLRRLRVPGGRNFEYRLSEMGLDLWRVMIAIWAWQEHWAPGPKKNRPVLRHHRCGRTTAPVLTCAQCGEAVGPRDTFLAAAPVTSVIGAMKPPRYRRSTVVGLGRDHSVRRQTLDIVGDRWSNLLLGALFTGKHGFDEFRRELGLPPALLSHRLERFVSAGVIRREPYRGNARRRFYRLTEKGMALYPVVSHVVDWGNRWLSADPDSFVVIHKGCGKRFRPHFACGACHQPIDRQEIAIERPGRRSAAH